MAIKRSIFAFILIFIICVACVNVSQGIEVNPTKEQINEAISYGEAHSGDIFKAEYIVPATFGNWPEFGGGLIKSKLVNLAVVSSMKLRGKKKLTSEEEEEITKSKNLTISYRSSSDVHKIKLIQGSKVIEPVEMTKPDLSDKDPTKHVMFITASFPYSELDPNAKTTIVVEKDFGAIRYEVNFSRIK